MAMVRPFFTPLLAATLAATATLPAFAFEDDRLTIWMGDNKGQEGIRAVADQFLEETGIEVEVVFPDNLTDRFQLSLEGINITDEETKGYTMHPSFPTMYELSGRRFTLGLRMEW